MLHAPLQRSAQPICMCEAHAPKVNDGHRAGAHISKHVLRHPLTPTNCHRLAPDHIYVQDLCRDLLHDLHLAPVPPPGQADNLLHCAGRWASHLVCATVAIPKHKSGVGVAVAKPTSVLSFNQRLERQGRHRVPNGAVLQLRRQRVGSKLVDAQMSSAREPFHYVHDIPAKLRQYHVPIEELQADHIEGADVWPCCQVPEPSLIRSLLC
mmetsp:Transcript_67144/g.143675  ORF Transcript_67144/g.143675 Transcript_67144/m.143675 type:complete len:209 (+) Transcript_67144:192-818(+)